jgi:hypothetical protein
MAEQVKITQSRDFLVTEIRRLDKNMRPRGIKQVEQREMKPWESWALEMLNRCNRESRKTALLDLIKVLVQETCETLLKSGTEGPKVTDIRFKLLQEYKDDLVSRLDGDATLAAREGMVK